MHLFFFIRNFGSGLSPKVAYIFKVFGAQNCLRSQETLATIQNRYL